MILISFYGHDVIGDLMPAFTLAPDKIYVLYDVRRCRRIDIGNLKKALKNRLTEASVVSVECDSFSVKTVHLAFAKIMNENAGQTVYIDVTGGPELLTAAGCGYAREKGGIPVYIDLDKGVLFEVYDESKKMTAAKITLQDYLTAIGARQFSHSHQLPLKEEYDAICAMSEYIFDNLAAWSRLEKYFEATIGGEELYEFTFNGWEMERDYSKEHIAGMEKLLDEFVKYGFLEQLSRIDYAITEKKYRQYLTTYGIWLEMYVYINALKYYNEVYLGFIIDWNANEDIKANDNEIDVIVMDGSMPVFISCKTRKPEAKDVCEVGFLARRLGGARARSALATTYAVRETGDSGNSIYARMQKFDVGLIEAKDIRRGDVQEVFSKAFKTQWVEK